MVKLSEWEQFVVGLVISLLTFLQTKIKAGSAYTLSGWESFGVTLGLSLLTFLATLVKNPTELAGIQAAIAFLQQLLNGQPVELSAIHDAIAFLNQLLAGQVGTVSPPVAA
jgi:hypothetical protein